MCGRDFFGSSYDQINMKINCVLAGKDWQKDAVRVAEIAKKYRIHVRFIELMPIQNQEEREIWKKK